MKPNDYLHHAFLSIVVIGASLLMVSPIVTGCAASTVVVDADKNTDFSRLRSFGFTTAEVRDPKGSYFAGEDFKRNLWSVIKTELSGRGLVYQDANQNPDIVVDYHIIVSYSTEKIKEREAYPRGSITDWRFYPYGVRPLPYRWNNSFRRITHTDGTLMIDVVNARDSLLIWRGSLEMRENDSAKARERMLENARAILSEYPKR